MTTTRPSSARATRAGALASAPMVTECAQLRIRVVALENLVIALLAQAPERQLMLAREMAQHISPRAGFTPHRLTLHAADEMRSLVDRAARFRSPQRLPAYSGTGMPRASDGIGALPPPTASIFNDEWDMLMSAIQERLRLTAGAVPQQDRDGVSEPVRACVLECVQALQQLQALRLHAGPRPGGGERLAAARGRIRAQER